METTEIIVLTGIACFVIGVLGTALIIFTTADFTDKDCICEQQEDFGPYAEEIKHFNGAFYESIQNNQNIIINNQNKILGEFAR